MDYATMMQNVHQMAAPYPIAHPDIQSRPRQMFSFPYSGDPLFLMPHIPHQRDISDSQMAMPSKQTEPKPRLAKDEVDLLENEFKKNPKPSSQRKREIAELLNVENPRINNWFQNRRAKAKQLLRREMDTRAPGDESPSGTSPEQKDSIMGDFYSTAEPNQPLQASTASFSTIEQQQQLDFFAPTHDAPVANNISPSVEEYPSPKSLVFPPVNTHDISYAPVVHNFVTSSDASPTGQDSSLDTFEGIDHDQVLHDLDQSLGAFVPFTTTMGMETIMSAPTMPFHSELLGMDGVPHLSHDSVSPLTSDTQVMNHSLSSAIQQMSSPTSSHSPLSAVSDLRFKSPPPPANIATRRNKGAPAMLNPTSLRTSPYGPKTGVDLGKRIDAPGPIRRISSANGLINRIQKPTGAPAPRSPLYFERNKEAFMQSLQNATAAAVAAGVPVPSCPVSLAPPASSNVSPVIARMQQVGSEPGASVPDEDLSFSLSTSIPHAFFNAGPTLKTPPGTPGLQGSRNADQQGAAVDIWNFVPQDEALLTPSLGSFGSDEFQMLSSAPTYTVNSQPATPSFGQQVGNGCIPMSFHGNGMGPVDYAFAGEAYGLPESLSRSSPERSKSKQFQFTQNITPDDFFSLEK